MEISWNILFSIALLPNIINLALGSQAFVNQVPDRRCRKRGQFLTHTSDRCKYMVCEFDLGSDDYNPGMMYATEMLCAPGTRVSAYSYSAGGTLYGNPCADISEKCRGSSKSSYSRSSYSSYRPSSSKVVHQMSSASSSRGFSPRRQSSGGYSSSSRSSRRPKIVFQVSQPRSQRRMTYSAPRASPSGYSSGSSRSPKVIQLPHHFSEGRCTRLGEYLTHPRDRCKYIVCEYALNNIIGYGTQPGKMYAREMKCAPGTAVPRSRYTSVRSGWMKSPCTTHFQGYCPAEVSASGSSGYSSSYASSSNSRYHPVSKSESSRSSYWA